MNRSKKSIVAGLVVIVLYASVEFMLFSTGHVGSFNTARRIAADAPTVERHGELLAYVGIERMDSGSLVRLPAGEHESNVAVYKPVYAPDNAPYVFVLKEGDRYFKYRVPRAAWRM